MEDQEFERLIKIQPPNDIVQEVVYDSFPFCFDGKQDSYISLRKKICKKFDIHPQNFTIVGSAKTGFSMNPDKYPTRFHATSDIDVVLVSDELFQAVWLELN